MEEKENIGREMGRQKGKRRGGDRKEKEMDRPAGRLREQRWGTSHTEPERRGERGRGDREKLMGVEPQATRDEEVRNGMRKGLPGGPVVKTPCLQCRRRGFHPWVGELRLYTPCGSANGQERKMIETG